MRLHRGHSWLHHRHIVDNGCGAQTTLHRHTAQTHYTDILHRYWRRQRSHGKPPHSKLGHQNFLQPMQCWGGDKVTKVINIIIETSSGKMLGNFTKIIRLCQLVARIPPTPRSNPETEDFYYFLWFSLFLAIFIISCDFHYFLWFSLFLVIEILSFLAISSDFYYFLGGKMLGYNLQSAPLHCNKSHKRIREGVR